MSRRKVKARCERPGCEAPAVARGMCHRHYTRLMQGRDLDAPPRIHRPRQELAELRAQAVELRRAGIDYPTIGQIVGLTPGQARQAANAAGLHGRAQATSLHGTPKQWLHGCECPLCTTDRETRTGAAWDAARAARADITAGTHIPGSSCICPACRTQQAAKLSARNAATKPTGRGERPPWTVEEDEAVMSDRPIREIAEALGRSYNAVTTRRHQLKSPKRDQSTTPPRPAPDQAPAIRRLYGAPDGHGRYAILDTDDDGRLICHECGHSYRHLATHVRQRHDMMPEAYRAAHGLGAATRLVAADTRETMRAAWARNSDLHLAALEEKRDPVRAGGASRGVPWAMETRVKRSKAQQAKAGRSLTTAEVIFLGDPLDIPAWTPRARALLEAGDVGVNAIARASGISTSTVRQRLRRYPAT